jgi:hypothetical protein
MSIKRIEKGQLRRWGTDGQVFTVMNRASPGKGRQPEVWWILQEGAVAHRDAGFIESFSKPVQG